jgi:LmbE family N-acetylglucosaminyl deacetylase
VATLILSPHFDDAVLSCWHLLDGGTEVVVVVNVFGGVPPPDAAGWWDLAGGMRGSYGVVEQRRSEDKAALELAQREAINLDFLDDQYRDGLQPLAPVVQRLRALLTAETSLWAPAALAAPADGHGVIGAPRRPHPDHVVVRSAALALHAEGCPVILYADLPHASAQGLPPWVTGHLDGARAAVADRWRRCLADTGVDDADAEIHRLTGRPMARKLEAVRCYSSQLALLERGFGRPVDAPELLDYEIVWRLR